jgi:SAM-dependent methyltransferase
MEANQKKILKSVTLGLRHLLEGWHDAVGAWQPGDLENRLASLGVRRDRKDVPVDELQLSSTDRNARRLIDSYVKLRVDAGVPREEAVADYLREAAYTWANRLIALRCMESRDLIDAVILQHEVYGGRSLEHHRLAQRQPESCAGEDDGLFAVLDKVFAEQAQRLPMLFAADAPGVALRPSPAAIKDCFGLLSLAPEVLRKHRIRLKEDESIPAADQPNPFVAPDALGWAYQYWNTEEKERVFTKVRTVKGAKIAGADIIPATQLYTEDYMVKFLVQNSLGATWLGMRPDSRLAAGWEYYVSDADRAPVTVKPVREITFLDPACGSGHFLLEAFDLFYAMYEEEGELSSPETISSAILTHNLFGVDIDARAVQIAEAALWMKAAERAFDFGGGATNLVAAAASHLKGPAWEAYLATFTKEPSVPRVLRRFAMTMEHIDEIGSLARPAEDLAEIVQEEHTTWEAQVRASREANFLFPDMRTDALSGQLPFNEISHEQFGHRLFNRAIFALDDFTRQARESGDFNDQLHVLLAAETRTGFRLLELLGRKYDLVAANPPYMGSKNMGAFLKPYVERQFDTGKRDLYSSFLLRSLELTKLNGRVAMVTLESWMFLSRFDKLRNFVLSTSRVRMIAHLGRHAFDEVDPPGNPVLFTLSNAEPTSDTFLTCFRLVESAPALEQAARLRRMIQTSSGGVYRKKSEAIRSLPGHRFAYFLSDKLTVLLQSQDVCGDHCAILQGLASANDERFLRFIWEKPEHESEWKRFSKGGGFQRWKGNEHWVVDWRQRGVRIKSLIDPRTGKPYSNVWMLKAAEAKYFLRPGLTYTKMGSRSMDARELNADSVFGAKGSGLFPSDAFSAHALMAYLNTNLATFLLRSVTPKKEFSEGHVRLLPKFGSIESLESIGRENAACKAKIVSNNLCEASFDGLIKQFAGLAIISGANRTYFDELRYATILATNSGFLNREIQKIANLSDDEMAIVYADTGLPVGLHSPVAEYSRPLSSILIENDAPSKMTLEELSQLKSRVRTEFTNWLSETGAIEIGAVDDNDDAENDGEDEDILENESGLPIPCESAIENISSMLQIHPISVYWIIAEGVEREKWQCKSRASELIRGTATEISLRLLGHRWPKQIEAREAVPEWADEDGIIPITQIVGESSLATRVEERFRANEIDASDFPEVMGKPLSAWLETEFFKHHTKQFKKRPIAWQVQSGSFTARRTPAFACLLYYHRVDVDALPKIRSQYVGPLRQRFETEQRGIQAVAADSRSERQMKRMAELEDSLAELQKFDATLEAVTAAGFGPPVQLPALRQFALDDAMLAVKSCWLTRLSELARASTLPAWRSSAADLQLHSELAAWIEQALTHLQYACASAGPAAPALKTFSADPTAADLAPVVQSAAEQLIKQSLTSACDRWWDQLDEAVFAPLKEDIKSRKAEQKLAEAHLKADPEPPSSEIRELKAQIKELKAEVKELDQQVKAKTAAARVLRETIEAWRPAEPHTWGDWLRMQPLFDQISSLDHRQPPPTTIAEFVAQESRYAPDINDGVRVNIAPLQKAGLLAADVLATKDLDRAIADRAEWRADERRWVREGKLPQPGWWPEAPSSEVQS